MTSFTSRTWITPAALLAIAMAFLLITHVTILQTVAIALIVTSQALAGAFFWRLARQHRSVGIIEATGVGLAIGTAAALISGAALRPLSSWAWLLPSLAALVIWIIRRARGHRLPRTTGPDRAGVVALLIGGILGALSLAANVANYPLTWSGMWGKYHPDMLFFEAISQGIARFGANDSILMAGGNIRYHWLAYAWAGQVSVSADAASFVVLTRVLPIVAIIATLTIAIGWSRRMTKVAWVPTLAAVLLISGGYVGATYGTILNFDSPSQSLSMIWMLALCVAFLVNLRAAQLSRAASAWLLAIIAVLAIAVSGGKISSAAIIAAGVAFTAVVGLLRRRAWARRAVIAALVVAAALVVTYAIVVAGSADPGGLKILQIVDRASSVQGLNPINTPRGIMVGTVIMMLAIVPRWAGVTWLVSARSTRWRASTILGLGLAIAGLATVVLISGGLNDTWFALAASAPLAVLSAVGVGKAVSTVSPRSMDRPTPIIWLGALLALALAVVVTAVWATGGGSLRWLGPIIGVLGAVGIGLLLARSRSLTGSSRARVLAMTILVLVCVSAPSRALGVASSAFGVLPDTGLSSSAFTPIVPFVENIDRTVVREWSSDDQAAADWILSHAGSDDIIATNVVFSPLVPALIRHRMMIAGLLYQAPYGTPSQLPTVLDREKASLAFIETPSASTLAPLCAAGASWVWVENSRTQLRDWAPWAEVAYANDAVTLLRITSESC
jgi:hypothetical protein